MRRSLLLLDLIIFAPLAAQAQLGPGGPPAVGVVRAQRQQITQSDEFIGRIQAVGRVALVARVTAFLEKRAFLEGAEVKKGDLLYRLEQPPFQAQVDADVANVAQLQAEHTYAQQQLARGEYLLKTPAGQQSVVDQETSNERSLAAQVSGALAQLKQAEINLGYTEILAPIDGKITISAVTEGNVVSPTSGTLATVVSQDPMYVMFPIAMREALDLRDRYAKIGGLRAVVIRLRLPNADCRPNHRHGHRARGYPQPGAPGPETRRSGFARIGRRRVRDRAGRGRAAYRCADDPARGGAVGSTGRLRPCRRCTEQGTAAAHPARSIDAVHGRRDRRPLGR